MTLDLQAIRDRAAHNKKYGTVAIGPLKYINRLLTEVGRLNAEVDSQARQIAARSGETTGERLFKELATAKQADLTKAEARLDRVRALHHPVPIYTTEAGDCEHGEDCSPVELYDGAYCPVHMDGLTCIECANLANSDGDVPAYPCPTIQALDGEATE